MRHIEPAKKRFPFGANRGKADLPVLLEWILALCRSKSFEREARHNQLQLIQTLPLSGRKQLMLIECAGERFLVGGGSDSIQAIVPIRSGEVRPVETTCEYASCQ